METPWTHLVIRSLLCVATGVLVYALTRWLRFRRRAWAFGDARAASLWGGLAVLVGWGLVSALFLLVARTAGEARASASGREFGPNDVLS